MSKGLKTPVFSFQVFLDMNQKTDKSNPVFTLVYSNQQNLLQLWQDLEGWDGLAAALKEHLEDARTLSPAEEFGSEIEEQFP